MLKFIICNILKLLHHMKHEFHQQTAMLPDKGSESEFYTRLKSCFFFSWGWILWTRSWFFLFVLENVRLCLCESEIRSLSSQPTCFSNCCNWTKMSNAWSPFKSWGKIYFGGLQHHYSGCNLMIRVSWGLECPLCRATSTVRTEMRIVLQTNSREMYLEN